jgi:AcrR family transcriptional regulator
MKMAATKGAATAAAGTKYQTPLRQAQRDLTRSRITAAARHLFYSNHFDSTTMEDIAAAAGLRRSTIYLHYRDKAEILVDVVADYVPKSKAMLATLPGPAPSLAQVERWIERVIAFLVEERMSFLILVELRGVRSHEVDLDGITLELMAGVGANNPLFADAAKAGADPALRARALLLFQQLTFACALHIENPQDRYARAMLDVVAGELHLHLSR